MRTRAYTTRISQRGNPEGGEGGLREIYRPVKRVNRVFNTTPNTSCSFRIVEKLGGEESNLFTKDLRAILQRRKNKMKYENTMENETRNLSS